MPFRPTSSLYKSPSQLSTSRAWIARQYRDPYVKKRLSDPASYRSRSAFKLIEIDSQWDNFLMKPDVNAVVDLGAAPGGWSQVVAGKLGWGPEVAKLPSGGFAYGNRREKAIKAAGTWSVPKQVTEGEEEFDPLNIDDYHGAVVGKGKKTIVAVDLLRIQPIHGVQCVQGDFMNPDIQELIRGYLSSKNNPSGKADIILSDMAANASGNDTHDIESSLEICEAVLEFAIKNLRKDRDIGRKRGGVLLIKHFVHPLLEQFRLTGLEPRFNDVKYIKPDASRSESREGYFLCQGFKR